MSHLPYLKSLKRLTQPERVNGKINLKSISKELLVLNYCAKVYALMYYLKSWL